MPPSEPNYPAEWLRIAEKDWRRVKQLLEDHDPELAGFCLQQSVEKFLKAFLLSHGWQLRKIHDLNALLDDAVIYEQNLENFRDACQTITAFYMAERYPFVIDYGLTEDDISCNKDAIQGLVDLIREKFKVD